jgi:hypothetical protein
VTDSDVAVALASLSRAFAEGSSFCLPFLELLPASHAALSTLGDPFGSETVCASDDRAARFDELQLDFGVGPCWDALALRRPIVESDLSEPGTSRWPWLTEALRDSGVRSLYAFPLTVGSLGVGAVDLYATVPSALSPAMIARASMFASVAAGYVLRRTMRRLSVPHGEGDGEGRYSRRETHQATGMVIAQLRIPAEDALALLQAHAYADGRSVREVAADVVARTLTFGDSGSDD